MIGIVRLIPDRSTRVKFLAAAVASAVVRAISVLVLFPLLTRLLSDEPSDALPWLAALVIAVVASWVVDRRLATVGWDIGFTLLTTLEADVVNRVSKTSFDWLTTRRRQIVQRAITTSGHELGTGVAYVLTPAVSGVVASLFIAIGLLFIAPWLGLIALVGIVLLVGALALGARLGRRAEESYDSASATLGDRIVEFAQSQQVLRSTGQTTSRASAMAGALTQQRRASTQLASAAVPGSLIFSLVAQLVLIALAITGAVLFRRGDLSAPEAVALIVVAVRYLEPFTSYAGLSLALEAARGGLRRVEEVRRAQALPEPATSATPDRAGPAVVLDNVSFRHGDGPWVLRDVSMTASAGSTVAIVGPSGSGKSTLLSLVARSADVNEGAIRLCGNDIRDYRLDALMSQLAIVFQDVYLFEGTLRDNVLLGRPDATDAQLTEAATTAQLGEVVSRLPDGWDTQVGEGGTSLSGGERQRVSIARAVLRDAPVLMLDEATSALDTQNERALLAALAQTHGRRTTLVVAHRLTTIEHADHIVFLENGAVVEQGTKDDLLRANGRFADYWQRRRTAAGWTLRAPTA